MPVNDWPLTIKLHPRKGHVCLDNGTICFVHGAVMRPRVVPPRPEHFVCCMACGQILCACRGKLAAAGADRVIALYDDAGERRDRFKTKGVDSSGAVPYAIRGMAFSPDGTLLAVGQSDGGVFVYRQGSLLAMHRRLYARECDRMYNSKHPLRRGSPAP